MFTYVYSYLLQEKFLRKTRAMCIEFQVDGAQILSCMCMCIEFVIQVSNQGNAHVFFPFGMVPVNPGARYCTVLEIFQAAM